MTKSLTDEEIEKLREIIQERERVKVEDARRRSAVETARIRRLFG